MSLEFQIHDSDKPLSQDHYWIIVDGEKTLARSEMLSSFTAAWTIANKVKEETWKYTFITFRDINGKYRWRIAGGNGEKVVSSTKAYDYEWQANSVRDEFKRNAPYAKVVDMT